VKIIIVFCKKFHENICFPENLCKTRANAGGKQKKLLFLPKTDLFSRKFPRKIEQPGDFRQIPSNYTKFRIIAKGAFSFQP
jgi:hypothetical protein